MTHHSSAGSDGLELDSSSVQAEWDAIRRDGAHERPSDRVLSQLRQQLAELERREQSLNAQALAVDAERRHLRWERREFDELVAERERQFAGLEASTTEQLKLREQADADLAAQAALLAQERAQWDSERTSLREALRAEVLEEVRREQSTVIETPEPQPVPLVDLEQERAAALAVLAEEVEQQRLGRQAALERELTAEAERLRSCADEELENVERLAARREQLTADLAGLEAQQAELTSELEQARLQHESELERRLQEVAQKQIDLEKRTRFHEVHLSQLRETLSQQREELEHREQSVQVRHVRMASAQRLQARHLAAFRERLEEREQSLLREKSLAEQARQMHDEEQQRRASEWQQERHEWQSAVEQQQSENHRQRDLLILQSRNLEGRRQRLDRLRNELETAHYETLELRVAVEQAWARLSQSFGEESARRRIDEARLAISQHFEQTRLGIADQREEVAEALQHLTQQRQEFRDEREEIRHWLESREAELSQRLEEATLLVESARSQERKWESERQRWLEERNNAEGVVRRLLSQLDEIAGSQDVPLRPAVGADAA